MRNLRDVTERILIIGLGTFVGTGVATVGGLLGAGIGVPGSDWAREEPWWGVLADPFALTVAIPVAAIAGTLSFAYALVALWRTDVRRSVPVVMAVGIASVVLTAPVVSFLSAPFGLGTVFVVLTGYLVSSRRPHAAPRDSAPPA